MMAEAVLSLRVRQCMLGLSFLCTLALLIQQELMQNVERFQANLKSYDTDNISIVTSRKTNTGAEKVLAYNITNSSVLNAIHYNSSDLNDIYYNTSVLNHIYEQKMFGTEDIQPFYRIGTHGDVYTVSIIATNVTAKNQWDTMVINGWEAYKHKHTRFKCCYLWDNGKFTPAVASKTYYKQSTRLRALQYRCPFGGDNEHLKGVAIEFYRLRCAGKEPARFQSPYFSIQQPKDSIGLCAKIVYGNISSKLLIDWLEYYKAMEVSKIVMFTYNISEITRNILDYYQDSGFVETRPFDFPWKVSDKIRDVGDKNAQAWQDEQVTVFDCQERLRGYSFVSVVDLDEFLLPLRDENLRDMMSTFLDRHPTAAGFTFMSYLFIKDWGVVEKNNGSDIVQYFNRTHAIYTRQKNIFIPSRVRHGSVSTHELTPKDGYTRVRVPESLAVINHYRNCYKDYHSVCNRVKRTTDYSILRMYNRIKHRTSLIKEIFDIT